MKLDPNAEKYFRGILFKTDDDNYHILFRYTNGTSANVIQLACEWHCHEPKIA